MNRALKRLDTFVREEARLDFLFRGDVREKLDRIEKMGEEHICLTCRHYVPVTGCTADSRGTYETAGRFVTRCEAYKQSIYIGRGEPKMDPGAPRNRNAEVI